MLSGLSLIPIVTSVAVSALVSKRTAAHQEEQWRLLQEQSARLARMEDRLAQLERPPAP